MNKIKQWLAARMFKSWTGYLRQLVESNSGSMTQTEDGDWILRTVDGRAVAIVDIAYPTTIWLEPSLEPTDAAQLTALVAVAVGGADRMAIGLGWDPDWADPPTTGTHLSVVPGTDEVH